MTLVRFHRNGRVAEREAAPGTRLLDVAQAAGEPLEGTCGGQMACGTCHVRLDPADWARVAPPSLDEEEMLDLLRGVTRTSRLACQVEVPAGEPFAVTTLG